MTASAPSLSPVVWKLLRARRDFVTREPPANTGPLRRRHSGRVAAGTATVLAILLGLAWLPWPEQVPTAPAVPVLDAPPVAPIWSEVPHPFVAYDLAGGPYAKLPLRYHARRDHGGGAREDTLTYGVAEPGQAFLRVAFLRHGAEEIAATSVFLDAARLAARAGLAVTRSGLGAELDTRFGAFEMAGVAVERGGHAADCLAFRLADPAAAPVLTLTGLACGTVEHPVDAVTLACTIDRLDLVSAGDDDALRAIFVAAERRRRDGCATRPSDPLRFGVADSGSIDRGLFRGPI